MVSIGWAQKNDSVFLKNRNIISGEIKGMSYALMTFKMDGPETISIK